MSNKLFTNTNSSSAVKRALTDVKFNDDKSEEYEGMQFAESASFRLKILGSSFGGFAEYFRRKKIKLKNQDDFLRSRAPNDAPQIFTNMVIFVCKLKCLIHANVSAD